MIRSRDLVLFVVAFLFLGIAISATLVAQRAGSSSVKEVSLQTDSVEIDGATQSDKSIDRSSIIERLKNKIAQGEVIEAVPSVEAPETPGGSMASTSLDCLAPSTGIEIARKWPLQNVSVETAEGVRLVVLSDFSEVPAESSGTSTVETNVVTTKTALLQLPLMPRKVSAPSCPSSEIIGVTTAGSLIFNGDASLYRVRGADELIGYALDGFPIYGSYTGETDNCGGYESTQGYRYAVSPVQNTILSCYQAIEQPFII